MYLSIIYLYIAQPAWGIRLILEALISFLPTPADGAIGALDWTKEERKRLAKESVKFCCAKCGPCLALLPKLKEGSAGTAKKPSRFQKEIEQLHALQVTHHEKKEEEDEDVKANEGEASATAEANVGSNSEQDKEEMEQSQAKNENADTEIPESISEEETQKTPATPVAIKAPATPAPSAGGDDVTPSDDPAAATNANDSIPAADQGPSREDVATRLFEEVDDDNNQNEPAASATEPAVAPAPARRAERTVVPSEEPPLAPWFSDPVVHAIIILFAILVAFMYRKFMNLLDELQSLTNEYASS